MQGLGSDPATGIWSALVRMFSSQSKLEINLLCIQLAHTRKTELSVGTYLSCTKGFAEQMALFIHPTNNDEPIDYEEYKSLIVEVAVSHMQLFVFYAHMLIIE